MVDDFQIENSLYSLFCAGETAEQVLSLLGPIVFICTVKNCR